MKVTFVCVGNTCRSPLLKGLFSHYAKTQGVECEVESAGLYVTDGKISPETEKMLLDCGISVENQNPTTLNKTLVDSSDLIVAVSSEIAEMIMKLGCENKVYSLSSPLLLGEDMLDPYHKGEEAYKQVFDQALRALPKVMSLLQMVK